MNELDPLKISFLRRYIEAQHRIDDKTEEIERIRQRLYPGSQKLSDMPGGGKRSDWTDTIAEIIEIENGIKDEIAELTNVRQSVLDAINAVEDDRYRVLLEKRYINDKTWQTVADEMHIDYLTTWRWHCVALSMVEIPNE